MGVRERVGGWMQSLGTRIVGDRGITGQEDRGVFSADSPYNVDMPVGNTDATPGSRQVWQLRPARIASRNLADGAAHLRAFLEWALVHVTGSGETRLHWPRVRDAARLRDAQSWLRDEWLAFQEVPYGARDESVPVLGQQVLFTMLRDGDAFAIPYMERGTMGRRRRRLQVYPGDALAETQLTVAPGREGLHRAMGISYDERGRAVTFHFGYGGKVQPVGWGGYASEVDQVDVPARRVWHFIDRARIDPATFRCLPWATAALDQMSRLDEFDRAFIRAAVMRAAVGLALKRDNEKTAVGGAATGALSARQMAMGGSEAARREKEYQVAQRRAGGILEIASGFDTANTYPGSPNAQEAILVERIEKRICGALRVSLATLLGDYKGQNFSASQQGTIQEKETVKRLQRVLVRTFYARVFDGFYLDRRQEMLDRFPAVMPEDDRSLRNPVQRLPQYVALEKHRMMNSVVLAFYKGLLTYAEARDELGQTTADIEAIIRQVQEDHEALGVPAGGGGDTMDGGDGEGGGADPDEGEGEDDGEGEGGGDGGEGRGGEG